MAERGFILLPDELASRVDLTPAHKLVLAVIGRIQGKSASCYPSMEYIAASAGISERTARRAINDLAKKKEIVRLFHHRQTSTYSANWATARNIRRKWAVQRAAERTA